MNIIGKKIIAPLTASFRSRVSPRLSSFYTAFGFADRRQLAANLVGLKADRVIQARITGQLAAHHLLKNDFRATSLADLKQHMFYGSIDHAQFKAFAGVPELAHLRANLEQGVFNARFDLTGVLDHGMKYAFLLGAAASLMLLATSLPSFAFVASAIAVTARTAKSFNPRLKLAGAARKFYPYSLVTALLFGGVTSYIFINDRFNPRYTNQKTITVSSVSNAVTARVCEAGSCGESKKVFEYKGPDADAAARAKESAGRLQAVINNQSLFQGAIVVEDDRITVTDRWFPGWVPFTTTRVIDIAAEKVSAQERQDHLISFFNGLWASGIMPSAEAHARFEAGKIEQHDFPRFRDPGLKTKLELASLSMGLRQYDKALALAQEITGHKSTVTTARPIFYDEAVFLQADVYRLMSIHDVSVGRLETAVTLLLASRDKLESKERGYRSRYQYELLKTCVLAAQFFPREPWPSRAVCSAKNTQAYLEAGTTGLNKYTPSFNDNFLAVRSFLEAGKLQLAVGNLSAARSEFESALALVRLVDTCGTISRGDPDLNWRQYEPYMAGADRFLGEHGGKSAGLRSFGLRCEAGRFLRGDTPVFKITDQFNPIYFKVFKAQAHQGLGVAERAAAMKEPKKLLEHLLGAETELKIAFDSVRDIQRDDIFRFFTIMLEEKQVYYEVLVDYASVLFDLYNLDVKNFAGNLDSAERLVEEVAGQKAAEPGDITYLRALFLQAEIKLARQQNGQSLAIYRAVMANIGAVEKLLKAGETLPPYYQTIKESASLRISVLSEINR